MNINKSLTVGIRVEQEVREEAKIRYLFIIRGTSWNVGVGIVSSIHKIGG